MKRLLLVLFVALMGMTTGGVFELFIPEQCEILESASDLADSDCGSSCTRCHCGRVYQMALTMTVMDGVVARLEVAVPPAPVAVPDPHDILHVPKPLLT